MFWGMKEKRHLVVVSSAKAAEIATLLLLSDSDDEKCNRLDWQKTVAVTRCDEKIAMLYTLAAQHLRRQLTYVQTLPQGTTLYIGSPSSVRRLRVYNKSAQMGVVAPNDGQELMRIELVLRDRAAKQSWAIARRYSLQRAAQVAATVAVAMLPGIECYVGLPQEELPSMERQESSYRPWVEAIVKPALTRAACTERELLIELLAFIRALVQGDGDEDCMV